MEPHDVLREAARVFEERDKTYGSNYLKMGDIMAAMFPNGITLKTADDFRRFALFEMIVGKMGRYSIALLTGKPHFDTPLDTAVYGAMLASVDEALRQKQQGERPEYP